jgi:Tol biopolymer transport system component
MYSIEDFLNIERSHSPTFVLNDTKILYFYVRENTAQLYLKDLKTGKSEQLTSTFEPIDTYTRHHSNSTIVFTKSKG